MEKSVEVGKSREVKTPRQRKGHVQGDLLEVFAFEVCAVSPPPNYEIMKLYQAKLGQLLQVKFNRWTTNSWGKGWKQWQQNLQQRFFSRTPFAGLFALSLCISLLISCSSNLPPSPLRVAINLWPGYETLYLARSLGYYDNTPIELLDFPSGTEQVRAFRSGNVDAAAISLDQALALATTIPDVRIVTVMDFSEGGDVILAKPNVPNVLSLKKKRVGVEANALGAYIITRALERVNLSPQDVQIVSLGLSEHERAFKNGEIDAVVTFGPARTKLLEAGAKQIFDSSQIPGEIVDVLVVRQSFMTKYPETVKALIQGRFRALNYLNQNPQDGARRIAPRTNVTPEQFLASLQGLRSPDILENQDLLGTGERSLIPVMQRLVELMVKQKLLSTSINPAALLNDYIVRDIVQTDPKITLKTSLKAAGSPSHKTASKP